MLRGKDVSLLRHSDMGIDFRNVDRAVSQHFLNIADIHIRLQKTCRKGMAEHMRRYVLVYGGKRGIFVDHPAHRLVRQRFPRLVHEKMIAGSYFRMKGGFVFGKNLEHGFGADLNAAFLAAFSIDKDCAVV